MRVIRNYIVKASERSGISRRARTEKVHSFPYARPLPHRRVSVRDHCLTIRLIPTY